MLNLIFGGQAKEYLPAHAIRRILSVQNELVPKAPGMTDRPPSGNPNTGSGQTRQTGLLSAAFIANPLQNSARTANSLGRNILSAGDRLRDLIIPDALAAVVSAPTWIPSMGLRRNGVGREGGPNAEKLRAELDDVLASSCPLCESVVAGLDKPFVKEGEVDTTWAL